MNILLFQTGNQAQQAVIIHESAKPFAHRIKLSDFFLCRIPLHPRILDQFRRYRPPVYDVCEYHVKDVQPGMGAEPEPRDHQQKPSPTEDEEVAYDHTENGAARCGDEQTERVDNQEATDNRGFSSAAFEPGEQGPIVTDQPGSCTDKVIGPLREKVIEKERRQEHLGHIEQSGQTAEPSPKMDTGRGCAHRIGCEYLICSRDRVFDLLNAFSGRYPSRYNAAPRNRSHQVPAKQSSSENEKIQWLLLDESGSALQNEIDFLLNGLDHERIVVPGAEVDNSYILRHIRLFDKLRDIVL